ncbi:tripartite-type tricarboxylate transporter receptor subunit TctC [Ottowia thiooxydans]|uniref:Tripartite-type tricarboxylate transporter receptor subunit TctC n=2 Tax=Ottowia thiooxydans TaxID=219182 RepID=A0ABV2Q887_9BURK
MPYLASCQSASDDACQSDRRAFGVRLRTLACAVLSLTGLSVAAQDNMTRIIVPFAAGGPNDVVARIAARAMAEPLGTTIIVENKPGATGAIASQYVADSKPDGKTMLLASSSTMLSPLLLKHVKFNPLKDFIPIGVMATDDNILVVHPSVKASNVQELIALAKEKPNGLNYSTSGNGSSYHLGTELFNSLLNIKMTHVPYKGTAPAVADLLAGHVQVQFQAVSQATGNIASGRVRPLGIASLSRHPAYPQIPPLSEAANLPGFEFSTWMGIFVAANTPEPELAKLRAALTKAAAQPEVRKQLTDIGMRPVSMSPDEVMARIKGDIDKWGPFIKKNAISAD